MPLTAQELRLRALEMAVEMYPEGYPIKAVFELADKLIAYLEDDLDALKDFGLR